VVDLNRAIAHSMAFGPEAGLRLVDEMAGAAALRNYAPLPAARCDVLFRAGRLAEARSEFEAVATLTRNVRERAFGSHYNWGITASQPGGSRDSLRLWVARVGIGREARRQHANPEIGSVDAAGLPFELDVQGRGDPLADRRQPGPLDVHRLRLREWPHVPS
jgi:hypothetical protein